MKHNAFERFVKDPSYAVPEINGWLRTTYGINPTIMRKAFGATAVESAPLEGESPEDMPPAGNMTKKNNIVRTEYEILYRNGKVTMPRMAPRGSAGTQKIDDTVETGILMKVPHYALVDSLKADDFINKRPFDGTYRDVKTVELALSEKLESGQYQFEELWEYNFCMAVRGLIMDGMQNEFLDIYDKYGLERKEIQIEFGSSNDKNPYAACLDVVSYQRKAAGHPHTQRIAFCSQSFYQMMRTNKYVYEAHLYQDSKFLRELGLEGFYHNDIQWVLYNNCTVEDGREYLWIPEGTAYVVPMGIPELFYETFAPADYMEALGAQGQNMYAKYELTKFAKGLDIEMQTNQIVHCSRPLGIVKLTCDTYQATNAEFIPPEPLQPKIRK